MQPAMSSRPEWDEYFLDIAEVVSTRASCPRASCGTVIVDLDHRIVATGYNGAPRGAPDCLTVGCDIVDNHCLRTVHSELNALLHARESVRGYTAYVYGHAGVCDRCRLHLNGAGIYMIIHRKGAGY